MTIRAMALDDLEMVLGWAADEGWNPGLDDAKAFHAADPQGFLINILDDEPVAAISVVNHDPSFAFLGLYLCMPQFRGRGHGMAIWKAGIAHAGERSIGLDGVLAQQGNYARSGFAAVGSTVRFEGHISSIPDPRVQQASPEDLRSLILRDAKIFGINRSAFATIWFDKSPDRMTMVLKDGNEITASATFRRCRFGTKVGPLHATSEADAQALLASNPFSDDSTLIFVDTQDHGSPLAVMLIKRGFNPIFETARMFRGVPPDTAPTLFQAIATMELG